MSKPISTILKMFVDAMKFIVSVSPSNVTDNLDGTFTLSMCNTGWLSCGQSIYDYTTDEAFKIVGININENITIKGTIYPQTFYVKAPYFFHGSIQMTDAELKRISDASDKFPMIYLQEIIDEEMYLDKDTPLERTSYLRLFFLDQANTKDWLTNEHTEQVVEPMYQMAREFLEVLKHASRVGEIEKYNIKPIVNFGVYQDNRGAIKKLFKDNASGVDVKLDLPLKSEDYCNLSKCK